ncbi:hypothetical protein ABH966_003150 [Lysinibacillus sp. RC46]|uniref:hypothetical protein n=2 Tax=Lysinibacillus TaxID=400634 RepID=UPI0035179A2C
MVYITRKQNSRSGLFDLTVLPPFMKHVIWMCYNQIYEEIYTNGAVWLNEIGGQMMDNQYVVGWGTLALINAALAQGKNRTGFNWFLLSLLLGPLATLILLFVEKRQ